MRYTPVSCTPNELHAYKIHARRFGGISSNLPPYKRWRDGRFAKYEFLRLMRGENLGLRQNFLGPLRGQVAAKWCQVAHYRWLSFSFFDTKIFEGQS
jgi:hypothetical protein